MAKSRGGTPIQQTIVLLEQEIEALDDRRGELLRVIDSLRPLAGEDAPTPHRARKPGPTHGSGKRPERAASQEAAILTALRAKGPSTPGALAKTLKLKRPTLAYQLKPLLKSGAVIATGTTADRQISLPPRSRVAKEAL